MSITRLEYLFQRYLNKEATGDERQELMELLQQSTYDPGIKALLDSVWNNLAIENRLPASKADAVFNAILAADRAIPATEAFMPARRVFMWKRVAMAAAVLLLLTAGWWFFYFNKPTPPVATTETQQPGNDLPPGKNNAVLLLADGRRINLDSTVNGELARQGNATITKKDGLVLYDAAKSSGTTGANNTLYNTISTARGNQFQLILPDGSTVWLNAESSIRFPIAFSGNERRVEVTGEVYFDVKHNSRMPFKVLANEVEVNDLGTQFNINAYRNEEGVKTTVVEGKVAIGNRQLAIDNKQLALPGQQVIVNAKGEMKLNKNADVEAAIAWKNGQFMFAGIAIQSVMRQLERWYDIEVTYAPNVSKEEYIGTITRYANISAVLSMLEKTGTVKFEVKGRKVLVK